VDRGYASGTLSGVQADEEAWGEEKGRRGASQRHATEMVRKSDMATEVAHGGPERLDRLEMPQMKRNKASKQANKLNGSGRTGERKGRTGLRGLRHSGAADDHTDLTTQNGKKHPMRVEEESGMRGKVARARQ